jgi:hypothetical protein
VSELFTSLCGSLEARCSLRYPAQFLLRVSHRRSIAASIGELDCRFEFPACARAIARGECKLAELAVNATSDPVPGIGRETMLQITEGIGILVQTYSCGAPMGIPERDFTKDHWRPLPIVLGDPLGKHLLGFEGPTRRQCGGTMIQQQQSITRM